MKRNMEIPHPGASLNEALEYLKISYKDYAEMIHEDPVYIENVCTGKDIISAKLALKISATIGGSAEFWLLKQNSYLLYLAKKETDISSLSKISFND